MGFKYSDSAYLVVKPDRYSRPSIDRMTKNKPALASGEIAVRIKLTIDPDLFKQFIPEIAVEINQPDIITPEVEVIENFEQPE